MSREPLAAGIGNSGNTGDVDEALALIRTLAQAAAQASTTHGLPTWRIKQAMSAVAQVVSGLGDVQCVTDDELRRYIEVYLDA